MEDYKEILKQLNNSFDSPILVQLPSTLPFDAGQRKELLKIGKILVKKSGKIVMRLQMPGSKEHVDLDINQGIGATFY